MAAIAGAVALLIAGLAVVASAGGQRGPSARAECGGLGVAADYSVFLRDSYTASNTQLEGRLAVGGSANVSNWAAGVAESADSGRLDVIVGGALTASNAQLPNGSGIYGSSLTGSLPTPNGTLTRADPPFSIADEMTEQEVRSDALGQLTPNGTISGPTYGAMELIGTDAERNVFTIDATTLQSAQRILIRVPTGATTIVNVTGSTYSTAEDVQTVSVEFWDGGGYQQLGDHPSAELNALRDATLWNFPQATTVQIGPGLAWQGSVLAPFADVRLEGNTQLYGQVIGRSLTGGGTVRDHHFAGCLPPEEVTPEARPLVLTSLCVDPIADTVAMRLRNTRDSARTVHWEDRLSAQEGDFTVAAQHDHLFTVQEGSRSHDIVATSEGATAREQTTTTECEGTIRLRKLVTGAAAPSSGTWTVHVSGDSGYSRDVRLPLGRTVDLTVPGQVLDGDVAIGVLPGGYRYTITEPDPKGAATTTVDQAPVTIHNGDLERVNVVNDYPATTPVEPPTVEPPTREPNVLPIGPVVPPGTPPTPSGPGIVVVSSGTDLAITERIVPGVVRRNGRVAVRVRVRNVSDVPAVGAVAREVAQLDPNNPNALARVLSISGGTGSSGRSTRAITGRDCTRRRPIRCKLGTLAPGQTVIVNATAQIYAARPLRSVVMVSSTTPDVNASNNFDNAHLRVVLPRPRVAAAISAPRVVHVGDRVTYRVSAIGTGRQGARFVRFCHRPLPGLLVSSAPGAFRRGGRLCRDVRRLRPGQRASFLVHVVPAARSAGRSFRLDATARAPGAPSSRASIPMRVLARTYGGRG